MAQRRPRPDRVACRQSTVCTSVTIGRLPLDPVDDCGPAGGESPVGQLAKLPLGVLVCGAFSSQLGVQPVDLVAEGGYVGGQLARHEVIASLIRPRATQVVVGFGHGHQLQNWGNRQIVGAVHSHAMYIASCCTSIRIGKVRGMDVREDMVVSEARANITEVLARVRLLRWTVFLFNRRTPVAAIVPIELGRLVRRAGGADRAAEILREHLGPEPGDDEA